MLNAKAFHPNMVKAGEGPSIISEVWSPKVFWTIHRISTTAVETIKEEREESPLQFEVEYEVENVASGVDDAYKTYKKNAYQTPRRRCHRSL